MSSQRRPELTEEEYLDIEEALASNARGRSFLRMRDNRARVVAANDVRKLQKEIKDALTKIQSEDAPSRDDARCGRGRARAADVDRSASGARGRGQAQAAHA